MGDLSDVLSVHRNSLSDRIDQGDDYVQNHWAVVEPLMDSWWTAYKNWEKSDTFNKAFRKKRMTVSTFPGGQIYPKGKTPFEKQVSKEFEAGSISLATYVKATKETEVRVFADSQYTPLGSDDELKRHDEIFHKSDEKYNYRALRWIDSSAFANPTASRPARRNTQRASTT